MSEVLSLATPSWRRERQAAVDALQAAREADPEAQTTLIIPAAQHPLEEGIYPGKEHTVRLEEGKTEFESIMQLGGAAVLHVSGSRHFDKPTGKLDKVALCDAAGRWLVDQGLPPEYLVGKEWMNEYLPEGVYSGAAELRVAAAGFAAHPEFARAIYICSPGQVKRAKTYALAFGLPLEILTPQALAEVTQFHNRGLQTVALNGLTKTVDPYGQGILARLTRNRRPPDGNTDTIPELRGKYADLPWNAQAA